MKRLTKYICDHAHGTEGTKENNLTGSYCRGEFEATAIVERLAAIEDILGDEYELDRLRELAQADKEGRVVILPFKTPGWGWSCRKGYPTAVEAYYPFPSSVMREIETGRYVGKTKEEAEDIFLKKMLRTKKE